MYLALTGPSNGGRATRGAVEQHVNRHQEEITVENDCDMTVRAEGQPDAIRQQGHPRTFEGFLELARHAIARFYPDIPTQGKFEYRDAYLKRLEQYIRGLFGPDEVTDTEGPLVFGVYFGDLLLKWFRGGRWEYQGQPSEPGRIVLSKLAVRWDDGNEYMVYPTVRIGKLLRDPRVDLVSTYFWLKHREAVIEALVNAEPGEWVEMPDDLRVRRVNPD